MFVIASGLFQQEKIEAVKLKKKNNDNPKGIKESERVRGWHKFFVSVATRSKVIYRRLGRWAVEDGERNRGNKMQISTNVDPKDSESIYNTNLSSIPIS